MKWEREKKKKRYEERSCSHMAPVEREQHIRAMSAKKWNAPPCKEFKIMVATISIDRSLPKIYLD